MGTLKDLAACNAIACLTARCKLQVLLTGDGFAVIEGLNNDAPIGCSLKFVSGALGVLLWRRSDNMVYALILGRQGAIEVGEPVECRIKAILQVRRASLTILSRYCCC